MQSLDQASSHAITGGAVVTIQNSTISGNGRSGVNINIRGESTLLHEIITDTLIIRTLNEDARILEAVYGVALRQSSDILSQGCQRTMTLYRLHGVRIIVL